MHLSASNTGLPFSSLTIAPSLQFLAHSPQVMHCSLSRTGNTVPTKPTSLMGALGQSCGQPEKPTLNLWWPVEVPNNVLSTSSADCWVSIRPLGLYSQPPQATGTLTRAPHDATC